MVEEIICGKNLPVLKTYPDNYFDSVVTDPPYHLVQNSRGGNSQPGDLSTPYERSGPSKKKGFMGKEWDGGDIAFNVEMWKEVLRVMKPGAHLLAFAGSGTTGIACKILGMQFVLIDDEQEYVDIAKARVKAWRKYVVREKPVEQEETPKNQSDLFS